MLHITYQNDIGKLDFKGGKGHNSWRILEIEGLGLTSKSFETAQYPATIGQRTLSETIGARTISIQCDVNSIASHYGNTSSNRWEISKALKILNEPGTLLISDGTRIRKINARCVEAVQGERHGGYVVFAMQFVCDYPYFEDKEINKVPLFQVEHLLGSTTRWYLKDGQLTKDAVERGTFLLPCMFTRYTSKASVVNIGDADTEPIIKIRLNGGTYNGTEGTPGTLIISNKSTKQKIELNLEDVESTTEVIVDIPNRKIYSQDNKNLIHHLAPTSFLSDFWLKKGQNEICIDNYISESSVVACEFSNKYIEAVIG